jgi:dihydrolipoamide dehydrogenase
MPAAVFTTPEVASVGMTENQCKEQGLEYICKKGLYRSNGKALAMNDTDGILKLITTPLTTDGGGKILGCHIMGAHAADIVQEIAVLMNFDATVRQLRDIVHIHPTLGEILQTTAENF